MRRLGLFLLLATAAPALDAGVVARQRAAVAGKVLFTLEVTCEATELIEAQVRVRGSGARAIVLLPGGEGLRFYGDGFGGVGHELLSRLEGAGWTLAEVRFARPWNFGTAERREGTRTLACRFAEVLRWVQAELSPGGPIRVTGHSGGAVGIGYALTHYGLGEGAAPTMDVAVATSGPAAHDIARSCVGDPPYEIDDRISIDQAYGYFDLDGPCVARDASWTERWVEDSLRSGELLWTTCLGLLVGARDPSATPLPHARHLKLEAEAAGSTVGLAVVDAGHQLPGELPGARVIHRLLLSDCPVAAEPE